MLKVTFYLQSAIYIFALLFVLLVLSFLVGSRELSVGTDTQNYADFFISVRESFFSSRFEFLFKVLTISIRSFSDSLALYFSLVFLIFNYVYLAFFYSALDDVRKPQYLLTFFGLMCASSWYIVATTNGLRQGLSLPFLYFSLLYLANRKYFRSSLFLLVSFGFHKAVSLVFPFIFLLFFRVTPVFIVFLVSAFLYFFGLTERLLSFISSVIPIDIYGYIISYGAETDKWVGFQLAFFVYTLFWGVVGYFVKEFLEKQWVLVYSRAFKFYCILMLPYFYFGFGAYSNRYAFIGWLFLPVLQAFFILGSKIDDVLKIVISLSLLALGVGSYAAYLTGLLN